jgi:hypothetical protein
MKQQYPEHKKLKVVQDQSQQIGGFLDWLSANELTICINTADTNRDELSGISRKQLGCPKRIQDLYLPSRRSPEQLLADYFDIDLQKIESEKRKMLEELRK